MSAYMDQHFLNKKHFLIKITSAYLTSKKKKKIHRSFEETSKLIKYFENEILEQSIIEINFKHLTETFPFQ